MGGVGDSACVCFFITQYAAFASHHPFIDFKERPQKPLAAEFFNKEYCYES